MNRTHSIWVRIVTFVLLTVFSVICVLFIPRFSDYLQRFLQESGKEIPHLSPIVYAWGILVTLPCMAILLTALRFPKAVAEDRIFTETFAGLLSRIALLFFVDCLMFFGAIVMLLLLREQLVSYLFLLLDLIGFALAFLLYLLANYIRRAAILQEEADNTL